MGTLRTGWSQVGRAALALVVAAVGLAIVTPAGAESSGPPAARDDAGAVNIVLDSAPSSETIAALAGFGRVLDVVDELNAVVLLAERSDLGAIRRIEHVDSAIPDEVAMLTPSPARRGASMASTGRSTWNQDALNIAEFGVGRTIDYDGEGVYVANIDTGLVPAWRTYLDKQHVHVGFARAFSEDDRHGDGLGRGGSRAWENDPTYHGTAQSALVIGFDINADQTLVGPDGWGPVEGTAPGATLIPIRVTTDAHPFSSRVSVIARALTYVGALKAGPLRHRPVVAFVVTQTFTDQPLLRTAVDYAIGQGVLVVAGAGNRGANGVTYPGAYSQAVSVGASGWVGQWQPGSDGNPFNFWRADDVPDPLDSDDSFVPGFSGRELPGQDLDVLAPGQYMVVPAPFMGRPDLDFAAGTSFATPHVAGIVALMAQKHPALTQAQAEAILEDSAVPLPAGCRTVSELILGEDEHTYCWDVDATGSGIADAARALSLTP